MEYKNIVKGTFLSRPNRFVAEVEINGKAHKVHVKNTGRCKELLVPGATVYLEDFSENMRNRTLAYSLISVVKKTDSGEMLINIDSQAPNKVVYEALQNGKLCLCGLCELDFIKSEAVYGSSRLDFYVKDKKGKEAYIEVKGVTLENNGVCMFPDAPTIRGIKHLEELCGIVKEGIDAFVIFVIQMEKASLFVPNVNTHKEFALALKKAHDCGVKVLAYTCYVQKETLSIKEKIKIKL